LAPVPRAATHPGLTDVLLVSPHESDRRMLERAIPRTEWNVLHVRTCEEGLAVMASVLVPVVLCDEHAAEGHWKAAIKCIITSPHPAPVLLTSAAWDWRLWVEAIDSGGFDLVAKPFQDGGVTEKLQLAFKHWKQGRVRRTWDHFFPR
jgi:DNA-binding NtrC family response regulator